MAVAATPDLIDHMLETLADESQVAKRLTAWEIDFLESVSGQWTRTRALSPKQIEVLERVYAEKAE